MPDLDILRALEKERVACITPERNRRMDEVLSQRTRYATIVLEDIYQPHNASAVLRSCDGFGFMDVHIIENKNTYRVNPDVALGSAQWLNLFRYNENDHNSEACIRHLRNKGYRIVATTPDEKSIPLTHFDASKGKFALIFGTELKGLSDIILQQADECIFIPMHGFTESFNISVSAALCMFQVKQQLHEKGIHWQLSEKEKLEIKVKWLQEQLHY